MQRQLLASAGSLARRRQYSKALDTLSAQSAASLNSYKDFFQGLLESESRGIAAPAQQALEKMRTLHRLQPDPETQELVISVFRQSRDVERLVDFLGGLEISALSPRATSLALQNLALAERLSHREFELAWRLIGNFHEFAEEDAVSAFRVARRGRWSFSRVARLVKAASATSVAVAREYMRCLAVCPDLNSADAVHASFRKFLDFHESEELRGAMVEVYARRDMLDHGFALASDAASGTGASEAWDPLVAAAVHRQDWELVACLWQRYEPRVARPGVLIDALAQAAVQRRSGAMAVAALTEALRRRSAEFPISEATLSSLRQLATAESQQQQHAAASPVGQKVARLLRLVESRGS